MSVSPEFKDFAYELFGDLGDITIKSMFGGGGIYARGVMFALIADETIYLKVDDQSKPDFDDAGLPPFTFTFKNGREGSMSYHRMPDEAVDDPDLALEWGRKGLEAALRADAAKPKRKRKAR